MAKISCGIDFGTSNSSIALANNQTIQLVPVEGSHITIPSALFFPRKENKPYFGRAAMDAFFAKQEGRYMRSLKRVLGTSLINQGTVINGKVMKFDHIISLFLQNMKDKTHTLVDDEIENVVMGRPVHFVDNNLAADTRAQEELKNIAQSIGFKNIEFQFEPIAAAFAHEVKVSGEKLALVVDLGGGTSDFTVIRLSNAYIAKKDRSADILANTGIRVGGNDFDKNLSLAAIMPELGHKTTYGDKKLEIPLKLYQELSEWSSINFLYTLKTISQTRQLLNQAHDKRRVQRLLRVLEEETGHALLAKVEETKIALTSQAEYETLVDFVEKGLLMNTSRMQFEEAIRDEIEKISNSAAECIQQAMVKPQDIEMVILTGGSTEVPMIQAAFKKLFPNAALADENKLSSVGLGLAYDSQKKFG
jgi:hypothetical chaperone protein